MLLIWCADLSFVGLIAALVWIGTLQGRVQALEQKLDRRNS